MYFLFNHRLFIFVFCCEERVIWCLIPYKYAYLNLSIYKGFKKLILTFIFALISFSEEWKCQNDKNYRDDTNATHQLFGDKTVHFYLDIIIWSIKVRVIYQIFLFNYIKDIRVKSSIDQYFIFDFLIQDFVYLFAYGKNANFILESFRNQRF